MCDQDRYSWFRDTGAKGFAIRLAFCIDLTEGFAIMLSLLGGSSFELWYAGNKWESLLLCIVNAFCTNRGVVRKPFIANK